MVFIASSVHFEVTLGIMRDSYVRKINYFYDKGNRPDRSCRSSSQQQDINYGWTILLLIRLLQSPGSCFWWRARQRTGLRANSERGPPTHHGSLQPHLSFLPSFLPCSFSTCPRLLSSTLQHPPFPSSPLRFQNFLLCSPAIPLNNTFISSVWKSFMGSEIT